MCSIPFAFRPFYLRYDVSLVSSCIYFLLNSFSESLKLFSVEFHWLSNLSAWFGYEYDLPNRYFTEHGYILLSLSNIGRVEHFMLEMYECECKYTYIDFKCTTRNKILFQFTVHPHIFTYIYAYVYRFAIFT